MDKISTLKSVIDFQKGVFFSWYNAMSFFQDQSASAMDTMLSQASWIPDQWRKVISNRASICKNERNRFKVYMEESFRILEEHLNEMPLPLKNAMPAPPPRPPKKESSYLNPGSYLNGDSIKEYSRDFPRLPALWTNSKNPRQLVANTAIQKNTTIAECSTPFVEK
jgi:hypothetical protein